MPIKNILVVLGIALIFAVYGLFAYINATKSSLIHRQANNIEALERQLNSITDDNIVFQHTIEELKLSKDSIDSVLVDTYKKLELKDKDIKSLSFTSYKATRVDTVTFKDTIFIKDLAIDTTIVDGKYYSIGLNLRYPDSIIVNPSFYSEKVIVTHYKKLWLNKPKYWLCRLFKKKDKVVEIKVRDTNPYIENKDIKVIGVIK